MGLEAKRKRKIWLRRKPRFDEGTCCLDIIRDEARRKEDHNDESGDVAV